MESNANTGSKCSCLFDGTEKSFKSVWECFWRHATIHGFPFVFSSFGAVKKGVWLIFSLGCLALLIFQIVSLTLLYLDYPVTLKKSWHHTTEVDFPAVTVCNTNPIKRSLVYLSPRISALLARWSAGRNRARRRRRDVETHSRQKRQVVEVSGYCAIANMDCAGNDITDHTGTVEDCVTACEGLSNCVAFNYLGTMCWIKHTCTSLTPLGWNEAIYIRRSGASGHLCPATPTTAQPTTEAQTTTSLPTTVELTTTAEITTEADATTMVDMTTEEVIEPTSQYDDREPYREDFIRESELLQALADEDEDIKQQMGYSLREFVVDCLFSGNDCLVSDFGTFFNAVHGNCYTFNANWNVNSTGLYSASKAGISAGLELMLNINQDEYLETNNQGAGAVVVIHPANRMPFPEDEGLLAKQNLMTSFEFKKVEVNRLGGPYGDCVDVKTKGKKDNVYEETLPIDFSTPACSKTCYQRHVIAECGCADPQIPMSGSAFSDFDGTACDIRNVTQDDCVYGVELQYIANELECECAEICSGIHYPVIVSQSRWPSQVETASIAEFLETEQNINITDREAYVSRNMLKLQIFFRELNFELNEEHPKYSIPLLINSFGASLGLFLGITLFSIIEIFELGFNFILVCCYKLCNKSKTSNQNNSPETGRDNSSQRAPGGFVAWG